MLGFEGNAPGLGLYERWSFVKVRGKGNLAPPLKAHHGKHNNLGRLNHGAKFLEMYTKP